MMRDDFGVLESTIAYELAFSTLGHVIDQFLQIFNFTCCAGN